MAARKSKITTAMTRQTWSVSRLAIELGMDRRTIAAKLAGVAPAERLTAGPTYWLTDVVRAVYAEPAGKLDLSSERAQLAHAQTEKVRLEVAQMRGELVPFEQLADTWGNYVANARAKILGLGSKLAPRVAAEKSIQVCQAIIDAAVYEILSELKEEGVRRASSNDDGDGGGSPSPGDPSVGAAAPADHQPVGRQKPGSRKRK